MPCPFYPIHRKKTGPKTGGWNLFWKKKKPETDIIRYDSDDLRHAFRYHFKEGRGFPVTFKGKEVFVLNISAKGLAFENQGFQLRDRDAIRFVLDVPNYRGNTLVSAGLRILTIDEESVCHCVFEDCSPEQDELLHKYVLEMQKNDLAH
jgi:hypothetical protein